MKCWKIKPNVTTCYPCQQEFNSLGSMMKNRNEIHPDPVKPCFKAVSVKKKGAFICIKRFQRIYTKNIEPQRINFEERKNVSTTNIIDFSLCRCQSC